MLIVGVFPNTADYPFHNVISEKCGYGSSWCVQQVNA